MARVKSFHGRVNSANNNAGSDYVALAPAFF